MLHTLAVLYRRLLPWTTFVGVTGSCGKTTTQKLVGAVLAGQSRGVIGDKIFNDAGQVMATVRTVRPWHRFCVHELGAPRPGAMALTTRAYRPHIGIVTRVGHDHWSRYRDLAATAREKGRLVESLPADGTAILNADDPHVLAMRERTKARVILYGLSDGADVRAEDISGAWPDPLALSVCWSGRRVRVQTRLLGTHWVPSVLAAMAAGIAVGIEPERAAEAIARVEPTEGRLSSHRTPDGVTFIRDDWKAPLWTTPATLEFMRAARAPRKLLVFGTLSDYSGSASRKYRSLARKALEAADEVIFTGRNAHLVLKLRAHAGDERIRAFDTVYELDRFLDGHLRAGDLVMLKGSNRADHLERVVHSRIPGGQECWRVKCGRMLPCLLCELRGDPSVPEIRRAA